MVGSTDASTPMAEMRGRATVRAHCPRQVRSCMVTIRFMVGRPPIGNLVGLVGEREYPLGLRDRDLPASAHFSPYGIR